ncbi:phosphoglycerate kinase [bacterium]|nr:phosphoglycerate kinase [bacterium]
MKQTSNLVSDYVSELPNLNLHKKHVLVRVDLNVTRNQDGTIRNDFKLKAILPTLELIKNKGGIIVLLGHCGRPKAQESNLSLELMTEWFKRHGFITTFARTPTEALSLLKTVKSDIVLLENLRFFKEETLLSQSFARDLAQLGTYYVQDAFANLHRNHTSMTLLAQQFVPENRTIGLLVEKELKTLRNLHNPEKPFIMIAGGNKAETKLPMIEHLIDKMSAFLPCPALVFPLLKVLNKPIGKTQVNDAALKAAESFLIKAYKHNLPIIWPIDYVVTPNTFEKPSGCFVTRVIEDSQVAIAFGPETAQLFKKSLQTAETIFLNGMSGNAAYPETLEGMRILIQALQNSNATKIISGGDTVALTQELGFNETIATFSTGGGSTLALLSGQILPGLIALR